MVILRYLCILPCVMVIFAIFPYSSCVLARTRETTSESTCNIFRSLTCQSIVNFFSFDKLVHHTPVVLVSLVAHFLYNLVKNLPESSNAPRGAYIAFFASAYMHFISRISICTKALYYSGSIYYSRVTVDPSVFICIFPLS